MGGNRAQKLTRWVGPVLGLALVLVAYGEPGGMRVFTAGRERYVALRELAPVFGMSLRGPFGRRLEMRSSWTVLEWETDSRQVRFNGYLVWLHAPVARVQGRWAITEADARGVIEPLLRRSRVLRPRRCRVVVLDPGHGGQDRGARGKRGVEEKGVVLDIAKRARTHLANAGLKVYLTRENDRFIELEERGRKAAGWGADLFVSIHLNAASSSTAKGLETYVLALPGYPPTSAAVAARVERLYFPGNRYDSVNGILGFYLHKALVDKIRGEDRGLRRARFVVLKNAPCPAVLVECGFLSNPSEETRMLESAYRERLALAIAKGILDYAGAIREAQPAR